MARRRQQTSSGDESLVSQWLSANPSYELTVSYAAVDQQWLVAVYMVGSRQIHGWRADPIGVGANTTLVKAMLQAIHEVERKR